MITTTIIKECEYVDNGVNERETITIELDGNVFENVNYMTADGFRYFTRTVNGKLIHERSWLPDGSEEEKTPLK
jgi:formylmethanofuran dehydrogenase subunit A